MGAFKFQVFASDARAHPSHIREVDMRMLSYWVNAAIIALLVWLAVSASGCAIARHLSHRTCSPIRVAIDPDVGGKTRLAVAKAVEYWAVDVGVPMTLSEDDGDVRVVWGHPSMAASRPLFSTVYGRAWTWARYNGCVTYAMIELAPDIASHPIEVQETVARHELGHVLGLANSMGSVDVMGRLDPNADWPEHPWRVSPQDELLIDREYRQ